MSHETLKRKDTPEAREYWEFVESVAADVRTHRLCFSNLCVLQDANCPKKPAASPPAAETGLVEDLAAVQRERAYLRDIVAKQANRISELLAELAALRATRSEGTR